jgi:Spy/CpxP family protein refolding chaperone
MKLRLIAAAVLLFSAMALAQDEVINLPPLHPSAPAATTPGEGFNFPGNFQPPAGLFDEFWNDPAFAAEIHLTDAQRKQLQEAALTQRLALVDGGADAFKALIKAAAILDADPFDESAYQKQLDELTASSGKLIHTLGAVASNPRRVLNGQQWAKLQKRQRERARQAAAAKAAATPNGAAPKIPSSLTQPIAR